MAKLANPHQKRLSKQLINQKFDTLVSIIDDHTTDLLYVWGFNGNDLSKNKHLPKPIKMAAAEANDAIKRVNKLLGNYNDGNGSRAKLLRNLRNIVIDRLRKQQHSLCLRVDLEDLNTHELAECRRMVVDKHIKKLLKQLYLNPDEVLNNLPVF